MAEYIEREAVKAAVRKRLNNSLIISWLISIINDCPTKDVAPVVHGRWLDGRCTNCAYEAPDFISYVGYELDDWEPTPYCPNCGARMIEEDK